MKNRDKISLFAFITVCVLLISLFASGITVFADGNISPVDKYNITEIFDTTMFLDFSNASNVFLTKSDSSYTTYNNFLSSRPTYPDNYYYSGISASLFNYYCWTNDRFYLCDADSFVAIANSGNSPTVMCYTHVSDEIYNYMLEHNNSISLSYISSTFDFYTLNASVNISQLRTIDNKRYFTTGYSSQKLLNSNLPVYPVDSVNNVTSLEGLEQINPNYTPSVDESENIRDHRNFNPAFMFINTNTNYGGDGLVTSLGYDKWQTNNLDRYKITWDYSLDFTIASTSDSHTSHFIKNGYSQSLDNIPTGRFAMSLPEIFITMYDGNTNCWNTIKDISMKTIKNDTSFGVEGGVNIGVANFALSANTPLTLDKTIGITEFKFYVTASIVADDSIDCGTFGYTYDFLDGTYTNTTTFKDQEDVNNTISQYNHDNNLSSGDTGYLDISDYQSNMPASNNYPAVSGGSVSQGGNASAQGGVAYGSNVNNSVIVNTGQSPKEVVDYIKGQLVPTGDGVGFVDNLRTATESNEFITLMSDTFTFVPATVWADLGFYFEIFLGILVASFVLRIILDLL